MTMLIKELNARSAARLVGAMGAVLGLLMGLVIGGHRRHDRRKRGGCN